MNYCKLSLLIILAACSFRDLEDAKQENLSFTFSSNVKVTRQETFKDDSLWKLPSRKEVDLTLCIKDRVRLSYLPDTEFLLINRDDGLERHLKTDINGCLIWTESIPFEYLSDEQYFTLPRRLVGFNEHYGVEDFDLAIDPWSNSPHAVADLRYTTIDKSLLKDAKVDTSLQNNLVIKSARFYLQERNYTDSSAELKMNLSFSPMIARREIHGNRTEEQLMFGSFFLKMVLIERLVDGNFKVVSAPEVLTVQVQDGKVQNTEDASIAVEILKIPQNFQNLSLAVRLEPIDPPSGLTYEEGTMEVYALNDGGGDFKRGDFGDFFDKDFFTYYSNKDLILANAPSEEFDDEFGFSIDDLDVNFVSSTLKSDASIREVTYDFTTCLYNPLIQDRVKGDSSFYVEVTDTDDNTMIDSFDTKTNANGCLHSSFKSNVDFFKRPGEFLNRKLIVKGLSSPYEGVAREIDFAIDPWEELAWTDSKNMGMLAMDVKKNDKVEFSFTNVGYRYLGDDERGVKVSRYLDLWLKKEYDLHINNPKLVRPHAYTRSAYYEVDDLEVTADIAILSTGSDEINFLPANVEDATFITGTTTKAKARDGAIVFPFSLMVYFNSLPILQRHTIALVKLSFKEMDPVYLSFPFIMAVSTGDNMQFSYDKQNDWVNWQDPVAMDKMIAKIKTNTIDMKMDATSPQELFWQSIKDTPNMQRLNIIEFAKAMSLSIEDAKAFLDEDIEPATLAKICSVFMKEEEPTNPYTLMLYNNNPYSNGLERESSNLKCQKDPHRYFDIMNLNHIEETLPLKERDVSFSYINPYNRLTIATGHYIFSEERNMTGSAMRYLSSKLDVPNMKILPDYPPFNGLAFSVDLGPRRDKQTGWANRVRSEVSTEMVVHELEINFRANFKKCFILKYAEESKNFYVCDDDLYNDKLQENWYYIYSREEDRNLRLIDPREQRTNDYIMLIRGETAYQDLVHGSSDLYNALFFVYPYTVINPIVYIDQLFNSALVDQIALGTIEGTTRHYRPYQRDSREWLLSPEGGYFVPLTNLIKGW